MFAAILILVISTAAFFRRISAFPLRNWDEAWYAEIIKNMASGNYSLLIPFWNGRYYFDHAPLYFWLSTPIFRIFGDGEWQARFISVVFAVFATMFVFLIGKKLVDTKAGILSTLIFATIGGVVIRFAHGNLDSLLVCLFLASFYFYLEGERRNIYSYLAGITLGLGLLVKSWGVGIFPLFLIFSYSYFKHRRFPKKTLVLIVVPAIFFLLWSVIGYWNFGQTFIKWYWFNPSENRLGNPIGNFSLEYFRFAIRDVGFWLIVPVLFLVVGFKKKFKASEPFIASSTLVCFVYIFFLNFLSDKSDWYLIPIYPLIALILGIFLGKLMEGASRVILLLFGVLLVVGYFNVIRIENIYPDRSIVGASLGAVARELIPYDDEVVLDDHDFTSFLYYSNQNHIFTLQEDRKPNEWWIIKKEELVDFVAKNPRSWIVKNRDSRLPLVYAPDQIKKVWGNYEFIKLY
ncbi:MAG: glycosyltransferase family 39 protein [Patescibacteria group bacterium]